MDVDEDNPNIFRWELSKCRPWQPIDQFVRPGNYCCEIRNTIIRIDKNYRAVDRLTMDDIMANVDQGKKYFISRKFNCALAHLELAWMNTLHFENDTNEQHLELFMTYAQSFLEQMKLDFAAASKLSLIHISEPTRPY